LTDYEWECRERASQRDRFMVYRKTRNFLELPEDPSNLGYDFIESDDSEVTKKFNFMTTVAIPVYDKRENAVSRNKVSELLFKIIFKNYHRAIGKNDKTTNTSQRNYFSNHILLLTYVHTHIQQQFKRT
jgi:hypothetical protein